MRPAGNIEVYIRSLEDYNYLSSRVAGVDGNNSGQLERIGSPYPAGHQLSIAAPNHTVLPSCPCFLVRTPPSVLRGVSTLGEGEPQGLPYLWYNINMSTVTIPILPLIAVNSQFPRVTVVEPSKNRVGILRIVLRGLAGSSEFHSFALETFHDSPVAFIFLVSFVALALIRLFSARGKMKSF